MLSRPFQGMARGRLFLLLIVLLLVEAVGAGSLYRNNRHASAAPTMTPTSTPALPAVTETLTVGRVQNSPGTVMVGRSETFSVRLPDLANKDVTYVVTYPDGSTARVRVLCDVSGFSQHTFIIQFKPNGRQETVGIGVYYQGQKRAFTQFAVQLPTRKDSALAAHCPSCLYP